MSHSSCWLTFELNFSIWVFFSSSHISFFVFIVILELFSVFIIAFGVSAKYISAVARMLNRLAEHVRVGVKKGNVVDYAHPLVGLSPCNSTRLCILHVMRLALELVPTIRCLEIWIV